jgi:hypothetical protein
MGTVNWNKVFQESHPRPGASERQIARFVKTVGQPLTPRELKWLGGLQPDPEQWKLPNRPLPRSYLSFLRWSNGGSFRNGDRLIQFFPALGPVHGVRVRMLAYGVPYRAPQMLPFAFDGGGTFYAFDMRRPAVLGEYPIVAKECGPSLSVLCRLERSFLLACRARRSIDQIWDARVRSSRR